MSTLAEIVSRIKFDKPIKANNSNYWFSIVERYYNIGKNGNDVNAVYQYFIPEEKVKWKKDIDGEYSMQVEPEAFKKLEDKLKEVKPHDFGIYPNSK